MKDESLRVEELKDKIKRVFIDWVLKSNPNADKEKVKKEVNKAANFIVKVLDKLRDLDKETFFDIIENSESFEEINNKIDSLKKEEVS